MINLKKKLGIEKEKLDIWQKIWLFAPIAIWFSYHPLIGLGKDDTMNFKLSVTMIYLAVLALVGLPTIWRKRYELIKSRVVWLVTIFVAWNGISVIWSANLMRGFLTFGVIGILYLIFLTTIAEKNKLQKILPALIKILIVTTVLMCVLAWVQMFAGIWLGRNETLLCSGCVAAQFGFVRPNVFAIEPQFFGNILLTPILILLWQIIRKKGNWRTSLLFIFTTATLILTLSRGAIFAFGGGAGIIFLSQIICDKAWKKAFLGLSLTMAAIVVALSVQGFTATINPNYNETFCGAVTKSINQLSMGIIKFREDKIDDTTQTQNSPSHIDEGNKKPAPNFDGYVEESTDVRLKLSELAIKTWTHNPSNTVFGVGIGGSGMAMNGIFPDEIGAREIIQNEFVEILLELGIVGAVIFIAMIVGLIHKTRRQWLLLSIIAVFLIQWNFFSGYPNALHVYLILTVVFVVKKPIVSLNNVTRD